MAQWAEKEEIICSAWPDTIDSMSLLLYPAASVCFFPEGSRGTQPSFRE